MGITAVLNEIAVEYEKFKQDQDSYTGFTENWGIVILKKLLGFVIDGQSLKSPETRESLLKIATVAVAAIEKFDKRMKSK